MSKNNCLMVESAGKKFFTHEENYATLIEFTNVIEAEMSIVKVKNVPILELQELASAFCNASFKSAPENIKILKKIKLQ